VKCAVEEFTTAWQDSNQVSSRAIFAFLDTIF